MNTEVDRTAKSVMIMSLKMLHFRNVRFLSTLYRAFCDRGRFLFELVEFSLKFVPLRESVRKSFPNVSLRTYWTPANWDSLQLLALTERFEVPVSTFPGIWDSWQIQEVSAFRSGEPAISEFFRIMGNPLNEQNRRQWTPILMELDREAFEILITKTPEGWEMVDGAHRLAIFVLEGRRTIGARVVYPIRRYFAGPLIRWFFLPFSQG